MKGVENLRQSLTHYLIGKGMAPGAVPFFVRGLVATLRGDPDMETGPLTRRMHQMGWDGFLLDETSLGFARSCLEAAGLEELNNKPARWFYKQFKAA